MSKFKIALSPYCRNIGKPNPKEYPFFQELIQLINNKYDNCHWTQISISGQEIIPGINDTIIDLPIKFLSKALKEFDCIICCDSMIQHLCYLLEIKCIVIFSVSDPLIFGHEENINILKDRNYLSKNQFLTWEYQDYKNKAFIDPEKIDIDFHYGTWLSEKEKTK